MEKLITLEWRQHDFRPYQTAFFIITAVLLGCLYLFAAIPLLDPGEPDIDLFRSYDTLIGLHGIITTAVFTIYSSVLYAKLLVEEYAGKRAVLLFLYPWKRTALLDAKLALIGMYTALAVLFCGCMNYGIFFATESFLPFGAEPVSIGDIGSSLLTVVCSALLSGALGLLALWAGFRRRSAVAVIVAACVLASVLSQIFAAAIGNIPLRLILLFPFLGAAVLARKSLHRQIEQMEL